MYTHSLTNTHIHVLTFKDKYMGTTVQEFSFATCFLNLDYVHVYTVFVQLLQFSVTCTCTLFLAVGSAPASNSCLTAPRWPFLTAHISAVSPFYVCVCVLEDRVRAKYKICWMPVQEHHTPVSSHSPLWPTTIAWKLFARFKVANSRFSWDHKI